MANPLEEYFQSNADGRLIHKWLHYFEIYHRHFEPYRGKPILIDDGGHTMRQQIATFEEMFPAVVDSGVFLSKTCIPAIARSTGAATENAGPSSNKPRI